MISNVGHRPNKQAKGFTKHYERCEKLGKTRITNPEHPNYDPKEKEQTLTSLETLAKIVQEYNLNERLNVLEELRKIREYKQLQSVADNAKKQIKISESFYKFID